MDYGWVGMRVKNADGREGIIVEEVKCGPLLSLWALVDGEKMMIWRLNAHGPDSGEPGWSWYCENFSGGPRWLCFV